MQERLSLSEVARRVGLSPIYLTTLFTRIEGMSLYRYQLRLRLASALTKLPRAGDLSELAHELGFSSHSHFSAAFDKRSVSRPRRCAASQALERDPAKIGRPSHNHFKAGAMNDHASVTRRSVLMGMMAPCIVHATRAQCADASRSLVVVEAPSNLGLKPLRKGHIPGAWQGAAGVAGGRSALRARTGPPLTKNA